jgi:two-component system, chemotaxis family, protein-glutamate methylesterase/glutaminase
MDRIIRVLIVDDSAYVRKVVKQMLARSPFIEVVGIARDGVEALDLVEQLKPDVVTCDLIMPNMDGVTFVREQMARRPVAIVIMSIASETGEDALTALDAGAIDFVQKPTALATEKILEISDELIAKVKAAADVPLARLQPTTSPDALSAPIQAAVACTPGSVDIVVIGISTGGPQALKQMIPQLPAAFPLPVAIVLHMPVGYTEMYARKLNESAPLTVTEAQEGDLVRAGVVLFAPAGRHMSFRREKDGSIVTHLDARPFDMPHRPAVDVLFQSAAEVYRERVLGVVMTGMGSDGKQGAGWIKAQGGLIFTEAEESCVVYGMPGSVVAAGLSDRIVPLERMAQAIQEVSGWQKS